MDSDIHTKKSQEKYVLSSHKGERPGKGLTSKTEVLDRNHSSLAKLQRKPTAHSPIPLHFSFIAEAR